MGVADKCKAEGPGLCPCGQQEQGKQYTQEAFHCRKLAERHVMKYSIFHTLVKTWPERGKKQAVRRGRWGCSQEVLGKSSYLSFLLHRSTIQLLRFPFSLFLLPVYLFALSEVPHIRWYPALLAFIVLHLLVYPSSNGYNSYM